jgi:hypothetical protein
MDGLRLDRSFTSKSNLSSCSTKPQGSEQKKSMFPSARCLGLADEFERDGMQSLFPSGERCSRRFVSSSWTYGNTDQGTVKVSWCQDANCTAWVRLFSVSANEDGASFPVRARLVTTARELQDSLCPDLSPRQSTSRQVSQVNTHVS